MPEKIAPSEEFTSYNFEFKSLRDLPLRTTAKFTIPSVALEDIVAHAREARPAECCGLLIGGGTVVTETVRTPNLSTDPNRFVIDPRAHIAARRAARDHGIQVLGFYHSHPHSLPAPSVTDLAEASYTEYLSLIVSPATDPAMIRLFRFVTGTFVEIPFTTI